MSSSKDLKADFDPSRRALLRQAAVVAGGAATFGLTPAAFAGHKTPAAPAAAPAATDITGKNIADIVKGYDKITGLVTLYRKQDDLYLEVTKAQLDTPFLLQATRETGTAGIGGIAGDPLADIIFQFHANNEDNQIYLVEPNLNYRAQAGTPQALSLQRSFAVSNLTAFPVEAYGAPADQLKTIAAIKDQQARLAALQQAATSYLIHIPTFFTTDIPGFVQQIGGYSIDQSQTYLTAVKDFQNNLVVRTSYSFSGAPAGAGFMGMMLQPDSSSLADPRGFVEEVAYNLFPLTNSGYTPRFYDDRIGYFTEDYETFDDDTSQSNIKRMILRWHLVKKDPTAVLSDPVKPIMFYVDNATPLKYRDAIKGGVLTWNAAFEALGFSNAVQCEIMPDDADWDPGDMTHNTVRWTSSYGAGYAVAQFRHNPLTGEMINAAITLDASMARFTNLEYPTTVLNGEPAADVAGVSLPGSQVALTPRQVAASIIDAPRTIVPANRCECNYGPGITKAATFGWDCLSLMADGEVVPGGAPSMDEFTNAYLHSVISHESGHCLGLRHNFKGSTMLDEAQRQDKSMTSQYGTTASVMDYLPANLPPVGGKWADIWSPCVGPYDKWAIAYGYTDFGGDPVAEASGLAALADQSQAFGHTFASDEDADALDPMITRFDMSAQPVDYRVAMIGRAHYMLNNIEYRYPAPGKSYFQLTRFFVRTLNAYAEHAMELSRFIGGIITNRNHDDDPDSALPIQAVPYADQRLALQGLCRYVLSSDSLQFSPTLLAKLEEDPSPMSDQLPQSYSAMQDISVLDFVSSTQSTGLYILMNHDILSRLETNEYRSGSIGDPLTVLETIQAVTDAVWTELDGKPHTIGLVRRRLQRAYVGALIDLVRPSAQDAVFGPTSNDDSGAFALLTLRRLAPKLALAEKVATDPSTEAHLAETTLQIHQFLHAQMTI